MKQTNYPSVNRIAEYLRIDIDKAKTVRALMDHTIDVLTLDPIQFPATTGWIRKCYNSPSKHEIRFFAIDEILGNFGVEVIGDVNNYPPRIDCEYSNAGDTYSPTVCFFNGRWILSDWGSIAERLPAFNE